MPSIGSITQTAARAGLREPRSSPRKPSSGKAGEQPADDQVLAGAVGFAHQILRALAVDVEQLSPGEMVGGDPAGFAHHRLGGAQPMVELDCGQAPMPPS